MSNWRNAIHSGLGFGQEGRKDVLGGQHDDPAANYKSKGIQGFLPPWLQWYTGKGKDKTLSPFALGLQGGTNNLADLFSNPGGLGSNISSAIAPRVAMESEAINRNTMGQLSEASGAAARSGSGGGFAQALAASIQQAGARQQANTTRQAMTDSAQLRRQDLSSLLETYRMLLDFTNSGRQALAGGQKMRLDTQRSGREGAGQVMDMIGSIVSSVGGGMS